MVVGRPCQKPCERHVDVVAGAHVARTVPFVHLIVQCAFPREFIRPCPRQSGRLARPVELDEQLVLSCFPEYSLLNLNHFLVIPVHEVHHHSLHAPFIELREDIVDILVKGRPVQPYVNVHAPAPGIFADGIEVQERHRPREVGSGTGNAEARAVVHVPGHVRITVNRMIFKSVVCSEINIVLVGQEIVSRLECRVGNLGVVPPRESRLSWFQPSRVFYFARVTETCQGRAFYQGPDSVTYHEHSPRGPAFLVQKHAVFRIVEPRREPAGQDPVFPDEIHSGIIDEIGLSHCEEFPASELE